MIDRSSVWIAMCDMAFAVLAVTIVAVHPSVKSGVEMKAEYLISAEWNVDIDADVDVWLSTPTKKPVFYSSMDVGCAKLDSDNRGFPSSVVTLADGSTTKVETNKETVSLRCIYPGRYDVGVNLFAFRKNGVAVSGPVPGPGVKVHVEIVAVNPTIHLVYSKDVVLDRVTQTINIESFDLKSDASIALVEPPLELVTSQAYRSVSTYPPTAATH